MQSDLRMGSKGSAVKQLQKLLNEWAKPGPQINEDGVFGVNTSNLVKKFQATHNLGIDGIVGPKTWAALSGNQPPARKPVVGRPATSAPWMKHAQNEIGQRELEGGQHNPRIIAYHATTKHAPKSDEVAWCSSFVNWALKQAGIKGTNSVAANSWLIWGKQTTAQVGAITVLYNPEAIRAGFSSSGNHVGFLVQETATHFTLLGGNQSDQVKESTYPKRTWTLKGYRWPDV